MRIGDYMFSRFLLFTTPICPNCLQVKEYIKNISLKGEFIDASTDEGLKKAVESGVSSVPTVLFLDEKGSVAGEAHAVDELKNLLEKNNS